MARAQLQGADAERLAVQEQLLHQELAASAQSCHSPPHSLAAQPDAVPTAPVGVSVVVSSAVGTDNQRFQLQQQQQQQQQQQSIRDEVAELRARVAANRVRSAATYGQHRTGTTAG